MIGIGWQELILIVIALLMCAVMLVPVVILSIVVVKRGRKTTADRAADTVRLSGDNSQQSTVRQPDAYATRYGFDASDWHSDSDDKPRNTTHT